MVIHLAKILGLATTTALFMLLLNFHPLQSQMFSPPALAQTRPQTKLKLRYVPPSRRAPKSTQATGSRGCSKQSPPVELALLVPQDHDGLTTSGHPTFFWYVSAPVLVKFALTEPGVALPLFEQPIQLQTSGVSQLKIPPSVPEIVPGREYRWSLSLICNPERPSTALFVQSWIQRVPTPPSLERQIAVATSWRDRASIYAQMGLWYDALAAISSAQSANPDDLSIIDERISLLQQVGIEPR